MTKKPKNNINTKKKLWELWRVRLLVLSAVILILGDMFELPAKLKAGYILFPGPQKQNQIMGSVVNDEEYPLKNINIRISHIGNSVTDDNGEFFFNLPSSVIPGSQIEYQIGEVIFNQDTLAIYYPPKGIWNVPVDPVGQQLRIKLIPRGDPRLLEDEALKLLLKEMVETEAEQKLKEYKSEISTLKQKNIILSKDNPIKDEAIRIGVSEETLLNALINYKQKILNSDNPYEAGLAALFDKNYQKAELLISKSIDFDEKSLNIAIDNLYKKYLDLCNVYIGMFNFTDAIIVANKAISIKQNNYLAYFRLGRLHSTIGNLNSALINFNNAISIIRENNFNKDTYIEMATLGNIGNILQQQGKVDSAKSLYLNILSYSRNHKLIESESIALTNLGLVYYNLGELDSAIYYHKMALDIDSTIGNKLGVANDLGNIGVILSIQGNLDGALSSYQEALNIHENFNDLYGVSSDLSNMGRILGLLGNQDSAFSLCWSAIQIDEKIGNRQGVAAGYSNVGVYYLNQGITDSANYYLHLALKMNHDMGFKHAEAANLGDIGNVFSDKGNADSAIYYLSSAVSLNRSLKDIVGEAKNVNNLGNLYYLNKNYDRALSSYQTSLELYRKTGDQIGNGIVLSNIGSIYIINGLQDSARLYLNEAYRIHDNLGFLDGKATDLRNIGVSFTREGNINTGLEYLYKSKQIFHDIKSPSEKSVEEQIRYFENQKTN